MYVRALAWWRAVPDEPPSKKPKPKAPIERKSRQAARFDAGGEPDMPAVTPESMYLVEMLLDAGPIVSSTSGTRALIWSDFESWEKVIGAEVRPWEARILRRLSNDYLAELNRAEAHDAPPPWEREPTPEHRSKVSQHIKNVLRG